MPRRSPLTVALVLLATASGLATVHGHAAAGSAPALQERAPLAGAHLAPDAGACALCRLSGDLRARVPAGGAEQRIAGPEPGSPLAPERRPLALRSRAGRGDSPRAPPHALPLA